MNKNLNKLLHHTFKEVEIDINDIDDLMVSLIQLADFVRDDIYKIKTELRSLKRKKPQFFNYH